LQQARVDTVLLIKPFIGSDPVRSDGFVVPAIRHQDNIISEDMIETGKTENQKN
jgi:hypothetical protein